MFNIIIPKISSFYKELIVNFLPLILFFFIFYIYIYKVHKKKITSHNNMICSLKIGDKVLIKNSILGSVCGFSDNGLLIIKIDANVNIYVKKKSITSIVSK